MKTRLSKDKTKSFSVFLKPNVWKKLHKDILEENRLRMRALEIGIPCGFTIKKREDKVCAMAWLASNRIKIFSFILQCDSQFDCVYSACKKFRGIIHKSVNNSSGIFAIWKEVDGWKNDWVFGSDFRFQWNGNSPPQGILSSDGKWILHSSSENGSFFPEIKKQRNSSDVSKNGEEKKSKANVQLPVSSLRNVFLK